MKIDLESLAGTRLLHKLLSYIKIHGDTKKKFHITCPEVLHTELQRGETCKLKALSVAIKHLAESFKHPYPALYKNKTHPTSLRQIAKELGSVQGEVYSLELLKKVCHKAGFESESYQSLNTDEYILHLEMLIDKNNAPIVFYDASLDGSRFGFPAIGDGNNEHAGVVVGYYKNEEDETHFIVSIWNSYFDFDGMELALSACHSLKDKRIPETFAKFFDATNQNTLWLLSKHEKYKMYLSQLDVKLRTALPMKDQDTPLRGQIMIVTKPRAPMLDEQHNFFALHSLNNKKAEKTESSKSLGEVNNNNRV